MGLRGVEWSRHLRSIVSGRRRGFPRCVHLSDRDEVDPHRSVEAPADPPLESGIRPLLDRQDLDPLEPVCPSVRRFAPLRALSEGARCENRAGRRDLLPACAGVHRSAHHRRRDGHPQRIVLPLLPGTSGANRDRSGHPRPGRFRRREDRARHQHVNRRWGAARSRFRAAQRPGGTGRRAVARLSCTAHGGELSESRAGSMRRCSLSSSCTCRSSRGVWSCSRPWRRRWARFWIRAWLRVPVS